MYCILYVRLPRLSTPFLGKIISFLALHPGRMPAGADYRASSRKKAFTAMEAPPLAPRYTS